MFNDDDYRDYPYDYDYDDDNCYRYSCCNYLCYSSAAAPAAAPAAAMLLCLY